MYEYISKLYSIAWIYLNGLNLSFKNPIKLEHILVIKINWCLAKGIEVNRNDRISYRYI